MNEQNCSNIELEKKILHKNIKDITENLNFIHSKEKIKYFKKLENPSPLFSIFLIYLWIDIFLSWYLTAWIHILFFPIAHHRYLGMKNKDPDYICIKELDPTHKKNCYQINILAIPNKIWLKSSYLGNLYYFNFKEILEVFLCWFIFLVTLIYIFSIKKVIILLILWFVSKTTIYHFLKVFMEISDHAGLELNGIIKSTRSIPSNLSSMIFFPFGDNYHLSHHLLPKIPTIKLKKAHKILIEWENHQKDCFPKRYFFGRKSVIMNWVIHRNKIDFT
ncbi:fatty acid desaturase [Silvanigrella sp.]|jgi:hypothetical protein|uniref:fatty acid desaturase n=1 Tax=Silvanigrella sp. TaxID=2024976 RepID=UPI0037C66CD3